MLQQEEATDGAGLDYTTASGCSGNAVSRRVTAYWTFRHQKRGGAKEGREEL